MRTTGGWDAGGGRPPGPAEPAGPAQVGPASAAGLASAAGASGADSSGDLFGDAWRWQTRWSLGAAGGAKINLTIPLTTLLGLTGNPGEAAGFGPIDADLARTMAAQAAASPTTTWCITVTDRDGHPTADGCENPAAAANPDATKRPGGRPARNHAGPWAPAPADQVQAASRSADTAGGDCVPPRKALDLTVDLEPLAVTGCDHRHETAAHDPSAHFATSCRSGTANARIHPAGGTRNVAISSTPFPGVRRRPDLLMQRRAPLPASPSSETSRRVAAAHPGPARIPHVDHTRRTTLHHRAHRLPGLAVAGIASGE